MSDNIIILNEKNFDETISVDKLILVDFWANWCGPCRMLGPVIEDTSIDYNKEEMLFGKVNVDEQEDIAKRYGIMSIPTIIFFKNGQILSKNIGYINKIELKKIIAQNLIGENK